MTMHPDEFLSQKDLMNAVGISRSTILNIQRRGFLMPGGRTTLREFSDWIIHTKGAWRGVGERFESIKVIAQWARLHPKPDFDRFVTLYEASITLHISMRKLRYMRARGMYFSEGYTTINDARSWLVRNPAPCGKLRKTALMSR